MKYRVMFTQTVTGFIEIEAENEAAALEIAEARYYEDGDELPAPTDCINHEFFIL